MFRESTQLLLAIVVIFSLTACAPPDTETAPTAAPTEHTGPDSTVVDADHYTAEFENDRVRIVRINYGPGEESVMHYHPAAVAVYLTDVHGQMTTPDGESVEMHAEAGQVELHPAGQHLPKNMADEPLELVLIELKAGAASAANPSAVDATVVDAAHYTTELENDDVRVVRIAYGPGEESVMHYHPDGVAVFLTDQMVQMTLPDGSTTDISAKAGEHMFIPGGEHLPKNISDQAWELIHVELK